MIRNSRPEIEGTRIGPGASQKPGIVKAIACKTGMSIVRLSVKEAGILPGITDGLNDMFARRQLNVEMVQSHADGVSFAVPSSPQLPDLLRTIDPSVRIEVEEQIAIVTLVGEAIASEPVTMGRGLAALARIAPVRMLTQGGCPRSIRFAVPDPRLSAAVEVLHREFFRAADPEIFATRPESSRELFLTGMDGEPAKAANKGWDRTSELVVAQ